MVSRHAALPLVVALSLSVGCGTDERSGPSPTEPHFEITLLSEATEDVTASAVARAVTVRVLNDYFRSVRNGSGSPRTLAVDSIMAGGTVTWRWGGSPHNVAPVGHTQFRRSPTRGAPFTYGPIRFNQRGRYLYRCTLHSQLSGGRPVGMAGVIHVR